MNKKLLEANTNPNLKPISNRPLEHPITAFNFPIVYWQNMNTNTISLIATYLEYLVSSNSYNELLGLIKQSNGLPSYNKQMTGNIVATTKNGRIQFYNGLKFSSINLGYATKATINAVILNFDIGRTRYLITVQGVLMKLKHNFTPVLLRDLHVSNIFGIGRIYKFILSFIRKKFAFYASDFLKKYFGRSITTQIFSRSNFKHATYDSLSSALYTLIDASDIPSDDYDKIFRLEYIANLAKLGWIGFVFYFPHQDQCLVISKRASFTYDNLKQVFGSKIHGNNKLSKDAEFYFDFRVVPLNAMRKMANLSHDEHSNLTKETLLKIIGSTKPVSSNTAFNIVKSWKK